MNNTKELSKIIDKYESVYKDTNLFLKRLDGFVVKHFWKKKVTEKTDKKLGKMYKKKN